MRRILLITWLGLFVSGCGSATNQIGESPAAPLTLSNKPSMASASNIADQNFRIEWEKARDASIKDSDLHLQKWKQQNIADYDLEISKVGPGHTNTWDRAPVLIEVRNGERRSIRLANAEDQRLIMARLDGFEEIDSIDKLFAYLKSEIENGRIVDVDYDQRLGYPELSTIRFTFAYIHGWRNIRVARVERKTNN